MATMAERMGWPFPEFIHTIAVEAYRRFQRSRAVTLRTLGRAPVAAIAKVVDLSRNSRMICSLMPEVQTLSARKVEVARHAGFCFGVKRAIRMVEEALAAGTGPVTSLGPVIHNPQVVRSLEEQGPAPGGEPRRGRRRASSSSAPTARPPHVHAELAAARPRGRRRHLPLRQEDAPPGAPPLQEGLPRRHRRRPQPLGDHQPHRGPRASSASSPPAPPTSTG